MCTLCHLHVSHSIYFIRLHHKTYLKCNICLGCIENAIECGFLHSWQSSYALLEILLALRSCLLHYVTEHAIDYLNLINL